jgi:hypothetical protein
MAYARTSTADQQNPEESLRWQLDIANTLIAGRAKIVGVVHDKDTSRSLPWSQRKEASGLLAQLTNQNRGWSGIVVGEPQRAFGDTGQVQTVLAQLNHYGVQLWVPIPLRRSTTSSCRSSAASAGPSATASVSA